MHNFRAPAQGAGAAVQGGIDFSQATRTADGRLCVIKESQVDQVVKDPILECTHKNVEKCHYTYVTKFKPAQEEVKSIENGSYEISLSYIITLSSNKIH